MTMPMDLARFAASLFRILLPRYLDRYVQYGGMPSMLRMHYAASSRGGYLLDS